MRELRFRSWDSEKSEMLEVVDLSGPISTYKWLGKIDVEIMQYVGLKDKNGVNIFEGDILQNDNGPISKVVFWEGAFCLDFGTGLIHFNFAPCRTKTVIGNIHENPELLK